MIKNAPIQKILAGLACVAFICLIGCNRGQYNNKDPYHPGIRCCHDTNIDSIEHKIKEVNPK